MPFQEINHPDPREGDRGTFMPAIFSLHWTPGDAGYIQLGVELDVDHVLGYLAQLRKDSPDDRKFKFYSDPLTRGEMQSLVRYARTARNAVHGADE